MTPNITLTTTPQPPSTSRELTKEEAEGFARELDALRDEILADLGQDDVEHIRKVIRACRYAEAGGRAMLHFGIGPVTFVLGTSLLTVAKILDNMEIGHNVMHGQYDWTNDPDLDGATFEWDMACDGDDWRRYHNFEHHVHTNILGKDRDLGYNLLRVSEEQPWSPIYLGQTVSALLLAALFQWGIGTHHIRAEELIRGEASFVPVAKSAVPFIKKAAGQLFKDYGLFPALAGLNAPRVIAGNMLANLSRSLWTGAVIFCGHFPEGARVYTEEETREESKGQWYARQINGSVNIEGSPLFHTMTGHLSHQIEHHLYPDIPAPRYPKIAGRVKAICGRYGQAYNTGTFGEQLGSVAKNLARFALPTLPEVRSLMPTRLNAAPA